MTYPELSATTQDVLRSLEEGERPLDEPVEFIQITEDVAPGQLAAFIEWWNSDED